MVAGPPFFGPDSVYCHQTQTALETQKRSEYQDEKQKKDLLPVITFR